MSFGNPKYVETKNGVIIFKEEIQHSYLVASLCYHVRDVKSAGFVSTTKSGLEFYGHSVSLGLNCNCDLSFKDGLIEIINNKSNQRMFISSSKVLKNLTEEMRRNFTVKHKRPLVNVKIGKNIKFILPQSTEGIHSTLRFFGYDTSEIDSVGAIEIKEEKIS